MGSADVSECQQRLDYGADGDPPVARSTRRSAAEVAMTLAAELERAVKPHGTAERATQEKRYLKSELADKQLV